MSSTNRGGQRSEADFYATPAWCVHRLLEANLNLAESGCRWLEPCAGDGAIIRAVNDGSFEGCSRFKTITWTAVELREECRTPLVAMPDVSMVYTGDFLDIGRTMQASLGTGDEVAFDACITNPPYSLAEPIIKTCLPLALTTIMLLRLNYLGSEGRSEFMRHHTPDLDLLPNRPSFCLNKHGKPSTDSIEYAWFHWAGTTEKSSGVIRILHSTPRSIRNAHAEKLRIRAYQDQDVERRFIEKANQGVQAYLKGYSQGRQG